MLFRSLTFTRWSQYYLGDRTMAHRELEALSQGAGKLVAFRPIDEWRTQGVGRQSELVAFLNQAEELLASSAETSCEGE